MAKRVRQVNPCLRKGQVDRGARGGMYFFHRQSGEKKSFSSCCEILHDPLVSLDKREGIYRIYYAEKTNKKLAGANLIPLNYQSECPDGYALVAPCNERYRHPDSEGTRLHQNQHGAKTKFQGCQSLEEAWIKEDAGNYEMADLPDFFEDLKKILSDAKDHSALLDPDSPEYQQALNDLSPHGSTLSGLRIKVHNRIEEGALESRSRQSFADGRGFSLHPYSDQALSLDQESEKVAKLRARVNTFMESLTPKQADAVNAVFFQNYTGLKLHEIAEELGISINSLKDRLSGSYKKLAKAFPEYKRVDGSHRSIPTWQTFKRGSKKKKVPQIPAPVKHTDKFGNVKIIKPDVSKASTPYDVRPDLNEVQIRNIKSQINLSALEKLIFLRKEIKFFSSKPRGNKPKRETYKGTPLVDFDYLFGH